MKFPAFALILLISTTGPLVAQPQSFSEISGHDFGERITESHQMISYLNHVAETSDRAELLELEVKTWDRKPQAMLIVSAPENMQRLDEIQENARQIRDPRATSRSEMEQLRENQPAIVYLGGSIHGFELSGAEAILKYLEHVVTSQDDEQVDEILRNSVILFDPIINADGRDAFAQYNHQRTGRLPNPSRDDWVNDVTSWEGLQFRTSHYFFDINRDWFAQTHRETAARAPIFQLWAPQVGVDAHEMGADVEFYFEPPTDPVAPFFPDYTSRWHEEFGDAYAEAFDRERYEYMTRERYNFFYPGYTTSYLSYQGAVGMLFEQGSSRGLAIERADKSVRTLSDAINQQYTATEALVQLSSERREDLITEYYEAHDEAIQDGEDGNRRYLIKPEGDPNHLAEAINLLMRSGVEVHRLNEETRLRNVSDRTGEELGRHTFPEGTYVIEAAQPRNRFIRTMLEAQTPVPEPFLEEARARIDRGENPRFYDITSWSIPMLFNLQGYSSRHGTSLDYELLESPVRTEVELPERAEYAYLIDGNQAAGIAALHRLRKQGYRGAMLQKPTRIEGEHYASGTVIFRTGQNPESLHDSIRLMADTYVLDINPVDTGLADDDYPSLGSGDVIPVKETDIALIAGHPMHGYSFGWAWFTLDRQYKIDQNILYAHSLGDKDLSEWDTLVMPALTDTSQFNSYLGDTGKQRLRNWVQDGGTLVAIGNATDYVREQLGIGELISYYDQEDNQDAQRFDVPGAFYEVQPDTHRWLRSGYEQQLPFLVFSDRVYFYEDQPPSAARRNVLKITDDTPRLSGHAWDESGERLPGATVLYEERSGSGRVIMFAEDPNFRGYWRGADRLFLNAVLVGPSAP